MDLDKARLQSKNHVHEPVLMSLAYVNLSSSRYLGDKEAASSSEAFIIIKKKFNQGSYPSRCQDTLHLPAWWRQCAVLQRQKSLHIAHSTDYCLLQQQLLTQESVFPSSSQEEGLKTPDPSPPQPQLGEKAPRSIFSDLSLCII